MSDLQIRMTDHDTYLRGIAMMRRRKVDNWLEHRIIFDPLGSIQYYGRELFDRIFICPIMATCNGEPAAFTCLYNISDTVVRFNGIYVEPKFRSQGLGMKMCDWGLAKWPKPWNRLIGYYRHDTFLRFTGSFGLKEFPDHYWRSDRIVEGVVKNKVILAYKDFNL